MNITTLKRQLLFRKALNKLDDHFSETETMTLIAIHIMNVTYCRCSCNSLLIFLSKMYRTPNKKRLLQSVRKFKENDLVRVYGNRNVSNHLLTAKGVAYVIELEKNLRTVKIPTTI